MQDEVIDNVVEYVDRLRNYTTTNISSIQAGMIPEILDIHWKVSPYYLDNGVKKYVFGKKEYVIQISGLRFKNNLPKRKNLVFKMSFQDAVNKGYAHPAVFFVNRHFIRWSDIVLVRDLKYTYLYIQNHFDISIVDPFKITDVQVIHIPLNVSGIVLLSQKLLPKIKLVGLPEPDIYFTDNCPHTIYQMENYKYKESVADRPTSELPIKKDDDHPAVS